MLRIILPIIGVTLVMVGIASGLDRHELLLLLPGEHDGFVPDEDGPYFFLSTTNLTDIYDGGYMTYVERGVISALSQVYTKDSSFYHTILHSMNSQENASVIVSYFKDLVSGGTVPVSEVDLGDGGFEYSDYGMRYVYFSKGNLFVRLEGGEAASKALTLSAQEVASKAIPEFIFPAVLLIAFTAVRFRLIALLPSS